MPSEWAASSASAIDGKRQDQFSSHRTAGDAVLERHAVEKFHRDEGLPVLIVNLVDGADIGVVQGGSGLRFPLKAAKSLGIFGDLVRKELQGNKAVQLYIFRLIDHAHPATAESLDDAIVRNGLADHSGGILRPAKSQVNESDRVG